jgi:hypothetical protein
MDTTASPRMLCREASARPHGPKTERVCVQNRTDTHTWLPLTYASVRGSANAPITSSNLAEIEVGSKVVYATVNGFGDLDSDVVLDLPGPGSNAAFGHCTLNASVSRCTFSGGTGKFTHFSARVAVSYLGGPDYGWDGTYSFTPRD